MSPARRSACCPPARSAARRSARLLVAFRPLWLLDEPITALDRASRDAARPAMTRSLRAGGMIVAATHEPLGLEEARELALGGAS